MNRKISEGLKKRTGQFFSSISRGAKIKSYFSSNKVPKLQLGSGLNILDGWLNTDLIPSENAIYLNVKKPFPLEDNIFQYIFCEHLIEHLDYSEGEFMLQECFRSLKPGGKIRIATPDLKFLTDLYNIEKSEIQKQYISWAANLFLSDIKDPSDTFVINNFFRNWGHKFIYDFKTLSNSLSGAGFVKIVGCSVGNSEDDNFQNIESHGKRIPDKFNKLETMVIEAEKPR